MTDVPYSLAERLLRAQRIENLRYEAFVQGYVHGRQDQEAEKVITSPDGLRDRTEALFESVESKIGGAEVQG